MLEEIHTECESPSKIVEKYQLTCQTSSIPWPLVPTVITEGCFETFKVLTLNTLYALQTNTGEPHITSMMFAHGGLPKRFVPVLGLEGDFMDLNTAYKHQIKFTHVKVMFLATCAQSVFYSPSKAKHLHHNRHIWALASDVWICTHPNMCITSKFTFDPLLDKMLWKFAAPDLRIWFWGLWWASVRHLHRYRNSHSHLPEADLQHSTGVTTLFPLFQSDNICFDFLELGLRQTT